MNFTLFIYKFVKYLKIIILIKNPILLWGRETWIREQGFFGSYLKPNRVSLNLIYSLFLHYLLF